MNRFFKIWIFLILLAQVGSTSAADKKSGIRIQASGLYAVSGSFIDSTRMCDYLDPGVSYGIGVRVRLSPHYAIDAGVDFGWMRVKKSMREDVSKEPLFLFPRINFTNLVYFNSGRVSIYSLFGLSIVPWRFTVNGFGGKSIRFEDENVQKMSIEFHGGFGIELRIYSGMSIYGEGVFHYLLCRDQFFFGEGFTEQGILRYGGGIILYLSRING